MSVAVEQTKVKMPRISLVITAFNEEQYLPLLLDSINSARQQYEAGSDEVEISALIINLKLGGTCIRDTDLFQKEVTKLLNADVEPVYNLIKQLAKLLPVYFNEIGAEGPLRDVTTEIDEITNRKDILIHFLRKQSHVESSNLIEEFIKEIFRFWRTKDKSHLRSFLPPEVYGQLPVEGPDIDDVHRGVRKILEENGLSKEEDLLGLTEEQVEAFMTQQPSISEVEKKRLALLIKIRRRPPPPASSGPPACPPRGGTQCGGYSAECEERASVHDTMLHRWQR